MISHGIIIDDIMLNIDKGYVHMGHDFCHYFDVLEWYLQWVSNGVTLVWHWANDLTNDQLEMNGSVISTVAIDVLVLKHQDISIHNADLLFIVIPWFHMKKKCI